MDKINTHGKNIDLESLEKAANATADWPINTGRTDIFYDPDTGKVWCVDHVGESWSQFDGNVIGVTSTIKKRSAQWIADRIAEELGEGV